MYPLCIIGVGMAPCWANPARGNPAHYNTPLVTETCTGDITVTDPTHPLYGQSLKLIGIARLPRFRRYCQAEIFPDEIIYVDVEATNLSQKPLPAPTRLTLESHNLDKPVP